MFLRSGSKQIIAFPPVSRFLLLVGFIIRSLFVTPAVADEGVPWHVVPLPVPGGFVDTLTGAIHLEFPITSIPQRNADPLIVKLIYDSDRIHYGISSGYLGTTGSGLRIFQGTVHSGTGFLASSSSQPCPTGYPIGSVTILSQPTFTDSNGTAHAIVNANLFTKQINCSTTGGVPYGSGSDIKSFNGIATDRSGYNFKVSNYNQLQVFSPDGWLVYDNTGANGFNYPKDTNGNYSVGTQSGQPDTLGRTPITAGTSTNGGCAGGPYYSVNPPAASSSSQMVIHNSDGSTSTYTLNCTAMSVAETYNGILFTKQFSFPTSFVLPDGTQYTFTYDTGSSPTHLGDLTGITLSTGGQISFTHVPGDWDSSGNAIDFAGWVNSVTFGGGVWSLSYTRNSSNKQITATVLTPPRYDSVSNSNIVDKTVFVSVPFPVLPTPSALQTVQYYSGSNTLLKTVSVTYDSNGNFLPVTVSTTLNDTGQSSSISYQYNNLLRSLPTQKQETDFSGAIARTTVTRYSGLNKPTSVTIYPGSGTGSPISITNYVYDEYSANYCKNGIPMLTNVTGATGHDDANYGSSFTSRGNVTTVQRLISGTTYATSHNCYDTLGNVTQAVDANGNPTSFGYSENWADSNCIPTGTNTHAFPTTVTDALGHQTKTAYYTCTSLKHSSQGPNDLAASRSGTVYAYDGFGRPLTITYPDTGLTTMAYPSPNLVTTTRAMSSSSNMQTAAVLDGYGRTIQTQLNSDPDCSTGDKTDTVYDAFGRVQSVSNAYCTTSDSTYGRTSYAYDAVGRTTQVTEPDGSTVLTKYTGSATQVQDEGNGTQRVTRISQTDGLGRLTSVCEVAPGPFVGAGGASSASLIGSAGTPASCGLLIAGAGFLTTYQYDALDNLLQVNQSGVAARTFAYDSLSRITSAANPESGTISYTYDANGNVLTKVAPAPDQTGSATVTTTYSYDTLSRLLSKSYSDGTTPSATFYYDIPPSWLGPRQNAIGRMTVFWTVACLFTALDYDQLGRVTGRYTNFPRPDGSCGGGNPRNYTYDLAGNLTSETDGAYQTRGYNYNSAGRLTSVTASGRTGWYIPPTLVSGMHYNAAGEVVSDTLLTVGSTATESRAFTNRGWLQSSSTIYNANSPIYSLSLTHAPNGDVTAANDSANGNWAYGYDAFNRLVCANLSNGTCASPTNGQPTYNYVYDRFGNRWQQNGPHSMQLSFSGSNNRMDGYSYDAAGNVLNDGTHSYTYDAENRIIKVDSGNTATYVYDAEGHSVQKAISAKTDQYEDPGTWDFLYDLSGRLITEMNGGNGGPVFWRGEVYAGSRHLATLAGNTYYDEQDQVGSDRARFTVTHDTFQLYNSTSTNLPFGDWLTWSGGNTSAINFTGQRRDPESGLDDFTARDYGSPLGRFTSPDPDGAGANHKSPQSWNAYAYVSNNPLNAIDPDGRNQLVCNSDYPQHCADLTDQQYAEFRKDNPNLHSNASGELSYTNPDGTETTIGSHTYYNEHAFDALIQAGRTAQIGLNWALLLTAPNYIAIGGAHALLAGSSLTVLSGQACAIACPAIPILGNKLDYLFGLAQNIGPNGAYNVQRSVSMLQDMERVGLSDSPATREYVTQKITEAFQNPAAVQAIQGNGRKVIDVFLMGPNGGIKLETIFQGSNLISMTTKR